ncbi:MAG TPA: TMEM175 family protein [Polyangia bacterium]
MNKSRLEAFSDGVLAIVITIMVLELKVPHGATWPALRPMIPVFLSYVLSFAYVGIYWNNHHHMLHATRHINGRILWANLHLLFWLSLIPVVTAWVGENPRAVPPTALYGAVLFMAGVAFFILERAIVAYNGRDSALARAVGHDHKAIASQILYAAAIALAFVARPLSQLIYLAVALLWLVPDRRIERAVSAERSAAPSGAGERR